MSIPTSVTVGPHTYTIVCDEAAINKASREANDHLDGICDHDKATITVRDDLAPTMLADTLLHECLHACMSLTGLAAELGREDEEKVVLRLAPALLDMLRRNPTLTRWLAA